MKKYLRHIKKNRSSRWALNLILIWVLISLGADFIANEKPVFIKVDGKSSFPIFKDYIHYLAGRQYVFDTRLIEKAQKVIRTPIPYSYNTVDLNNANFKSPFEKQNLESIRFRHWLGTDQIGRDVLAGLVHGARIAAIVGIFSMVIAGGLGLLFGLVAGYFGNRDLRMPVFYGIVLAILSCILMYLGYINWIDFKAQGKSYLGIGIIFLIIFILGLVVFLGLRKLRDIPGLRSLSFPLDSTIMKTIELLRSIPRLFILLALLPLFQRASLINIFIILGLISWPSIAQLIRAEVLKVREQPYIQSCKVLGIQPMRIIFHHVLPNSLGPFWVVLAFGVAGSIIAESSLSFLGIGIPIDQVSWGSMLNEARGHFSAWWLALFPGSALFFIILSFNIIGDRLREIPIFS